VNGDHLATTESTVTMPESVPRRSVLALAASSSLAGYSSVLSSSGEDDPDCSMLGDPESETDLPEDEHGYDVSAQLVTDESPSDSGTGAPYHDVPGDATVVPYACFEGRDVEPLRQVVRAAVDSDDVVAQNEVISEAEARRILALLPSEWGVEDPDFVSYDGRVAYVSLSVTWGPHRAP